MKRRLFNFAAAVSLIIALGLMALAIAGRWSTFGIGLVFHRSPTAPGEAFALSVDLKFLRITRAKLLPDRSQSQRAEFVRISYEPGPWGPVSLLHDALTGQRTSGQAAGTYWEALKIPHGLALMVCLALPGIALIRLARDALLPKVGFCSSCDYDPTGNTSGKCPECGAVEQKRRVVKLAKAVGAAEGERQP